MENDTTNNLVIRMTKDLEKKTQNCHTIDDLIKLSFSFQFDKYSIVPIQIKTEINTLLEILQANNPKNILEIGTANGGTLFLLCKIAAPNAKIISIDLPDGAFGGELYPHWKKKLYESFAKKSQKIYLLRADSHDIKTFEKTKELIGNDKFDFILIDGDHTLNGIEKDFEMYSKLIKAGGIIAFHDIRKGPKENVGGVPQFWNKIKNDFPSIEILDDLNEESYGIGLLFLGLSGEKYSQYVDALQILSKHKDQRIETLKNISKTNETPFQNDPIYTLLQIYYNRNDLQAQFSEVKEGKYDDLLEWAISVCEGHIDEKERTKSDLLKFSAQFKAILKNTNTGKLDLISKKIQDFSSTINEQNKLIQKISNEKNIVQNNLNSLSEQLSITSTNLDTSEKEKKNLSEQLEFLLPPNSDPMTLLLEIYQNRSDLQNQYPEVRKGNIRNLLDWSYGVVLGDIPDTESHLLGHFGAWYVREYYTLLLKDGIFVSNKKLSEIKNILRRSNTIIKEKGIIDLLRQIDEKIKTRKLNLIDDNLEHLTTKSSDFRKNKLNSTSILKKDSYTSSNKKKNLGKINKDLSKYVQNNIISYFEYTPKISIVLPVYNIDKIWLDTCINSVLNQTYRNWELCIVDDASTENHIKDVLSHYLACDNRIKVKFLETNYNISEASNEALKLSTGEFVTFLDHDDEITEDALFEVVKKLNLHKDTDIIYSDDAKIDKNGKKYDFQHKPDWSPELLLSYCYFSHLVVFRKKIIEQVGGFRKGYEGAQDYDLILRATEKTDKIHHIPKVLYYWRSIPSSTAYAADAKSDSIERGKKAVQEALIRRKISGNAIVPDFAKKNRLGIYKINFDLKETPTISIIITNKDKPDLLKNCIKTIETKLTYPNYEIIIVDTGSKEKETLDYLNATKHRVIHQPMTKFNFSRANNIGVSEATGKYVLLMNNDVEVITPNLIEEMIGYLEYDENIGIVGPKLLYKDHRVQHAGVVLGLNGGLAGHANKLNADWDPGYLWYASVARNYSAVTAAFMLIKKDLYQKVGGLDEKNLQVAYNDVDLCLKVMKMGKRIVYNPYALAYHYEGATRGVDNDFQEEETHFRNKWQKLIKHDPFYNPNLSLQNENFELKHPLYLSRILLVTHNLNHEGATNSLFYLSREFKRRGYDITVLSPIDGPLIKKFMEENIDVVIEPTLFSNPSSSIHFLKNFDIIYLNTILTFTLIETIKNLNIPLIWCIRESERDHYIDQGITATHFKHVDKVVFVSNATRKVYADLENNKNFVTIPNGLDIQEIESFKLHNSKNDLKRKYGFSQDSTLITIVGTVTERKGQHIFVEAAIKLLNSSKQNLHFVIVGARENNYLKKISSMIVDNHKQSNIHIVSETENVYDYYFMSDIFVCASLIESFPRVTLEAMAFELPIISTDVFGIPEQIESGKEGILIKPKNSTILSEKIQLFLNNKNMAEQCALNAHLKIRNNFTITKMLQSYEQLLEDFHASTIVIPYKT